MTSAPLMDGATYTVFIVDDFGDCWDGSDVDLVDCEGNVVLANLAQFIDPIAGDVNDELAWTTFTYNAPTPTVTWSGPGAVTTDPDNIPNNVDEIYTFDPSLAGATACTSVDVELMISLQVCGFGCSQAVTVTVFPPTQAPTIVRDDNTCTYTLTPACPNDVLNPATINAAPSEDPVDVNITVLTENACTGMFLIDPEMCPECLPEVPDFLPSRTIKKNN